MSEKEQIEMMYAIMDDEYSKLCKLETRAIKKGLWHEVCEYDAKKVMLKHLIDRFAKEINAA